MELPTVGVGVVNPSNFNYSSECFSGCMIFVLILLITNVVQHLFLLLFVPKKKVVFFLQICRTSLCSLNMSLCQMYVMQIPSPTFLVCLFTLKSVV